jgi:protein-tyrosine phosphatase
MSHPVDRFEHPALAAPLFFTPCPGTQSTSIDDALLALKASGAKAVVTLTPHEEMERLGVPTLGERCSAHGLAWFHLPIGDDDAPGHAFEAEWSQALPHIRSLIGAGDGVAIHCRGGSGRTGLIAARILASHGAPMEEVVAAIQTLRPKALRNPAQVQWLRDHVGQ